MSAINIFLTPTRALIFTDAAQYDREGYITDLTDKAHVVPTANIVVSGSGNAWFPEMVARVVEEAGFGMDEILADRGHTIDECFRVAKPKMDAAGKNLNRVYLVGWSKAQARPVIASWDNTVKDRPFAMADLVASPAPDAVAGEAIRRAMGKFTPATVDYECLGLETMKAQRFMEGSAEFQAVGRFLVGGHVQRTDVTAAGIAKTIVHRWVEDRIGERIAPRPRLDPVSHANVSALPASRAERRRLEKLRRTEVA